MAKPLVGFKASGILLAILITFTAQGQEKSKSPCRIDISSLKNADSVGLSQTIRGRATIPPAGYLWIFAHREGLGVWWPQGGGPAKINNSGEWVVLATFGEPKDAGSNFEVKAVVLDKSASDEMEAYVRSTEKEGRYPGTKLPDSQQGCASNTVLVERR